MGHDKPRIAPPTPAKSLAKDFLRTCEELEIDLFPWQAISARYSYAIGADGRWLFPEFAEVVSRQNGKTRPLVPHIVHRLRMARRVMHTAQNRDLPREVFSEVADILGSRPGELAIKGGRIVMPRFANGQEEIRMKNGGVYRIVAPTRSGARGPSNDDLIIDEVRELDDFDFIAAAKPTLMASKNPQTIYKSNAGEEDSVVLNGLRQRAATDPSLAYLEWSANPDRRADDVIGWTEANPSIGHLPGLLGNLERDYRSHSLQGTMAIFETENLCRWVSTTREPLVDPFTWSQCEVELGTPVRPFMGISMDPNGQRASAAIAWPQADGTVALRLLFDVTGHPIDTDALGKDLRDTARSLGVFMVGFDPLTDAMLAKFLPRSEPISGQKWANASARFVAAVESRKLQWQDCPGVTDDLTWTARKPHDESGSFQAVRAQDDHPITASLAAVRAVWLASAPRPVSSTTASAMGF